MGSWFVCGLVLLSLGRLALAAKLHKTAESVFGVATREG